MLYFLYIQLNIKPLKYLYLSILLHRQTIVELAAVVFIEYVILFLRQNVFRIRFDKWK